jgi:iron complex outermembrane recepter protein
MPSSSRSPCALTLTAAAFAALIFAHTSIWAQQPSSAAAHHEVLPLVQIRATRLPDAPQAPATSQAPTLSLALADWLGPAPTNEQAWSQSVVSGEALNNANRLEDALALVPGVQVGNDGSGISSTVLLRGFKTTSLFTGGLPEMQWRFARDPYTAERLEVLRGPQGVLLGQAAPGGTLHWVPKLAGGAQRSEAGLGADGDGWARAWLDLNCPGPTLSTRLVLATQDGVTQPQSLPNRRTHVLGSVKLSPVDAFSATAWLEYQHTRRPWIFGTVIPNEKTGAVRYDQLYVVDGGLPAQRETRQGGLMLQGQLGEHWQLSGQWREGMLKRNEDMLGFWSTTANPQRLSGYYARFWDDWQQQSAQVKALGHWQSTDWDARLALGWDQLHASRGFYRWQSRRAFNIDVDANDYSDVKVDALKLSTTDISERWQDHSRWLGSTVTWREHTRLTLGWRETQVHRELRQDSPTQKATADQSGNSWQLGLSQDLTPWLTAYVSSGQAVQANAGHTLDGSFLPALKARQVEVGLHHRWRWGQGHRLVSQLAVFGIDQHHLTAPDPADPAREAVLPVGRWRSEGVELSSTWSQGLWAVQVQGSSLRYSPVVRTSSTQGKQLVGAVRDRGAIKLSHTASSSIQAWPRQGWALVQAAGPAAANATNTVMVKGYERLDLGAQWALPAQGELTVVLRNVFNRKYVEAVNGTDDVYQGPTRGLWVAANWMW